MSERPSVNWSGGNLANVIEPSAGKKSLGWLPGEKPPAQYFNWQQREHGLAYDYVNARVKTAEPVIIRSSGSISWNGADIVFASALQVIFRVNTGAQINQFSPTTLSLADGQVVVLKKDYVGASPVNISAGSYGSLAAGQYVILNETSLTGNDIENEMVLFRRRGSELEIPHLGQIVPSGTTFTIGSPGTVVLGSIAELPIGTIIPHYDYNGAYAFDATKWAYCNGQTKLFSGGVNRVTPDMSGRYLVGFGSDGTGDIATAAWDAAPVGNAGHAINIQHSHVVNAHTHDLGNHTHSVGSHTHLPGTLQFAVLNIVANNNIYGFQSTGIQAPACSVQSYQTGAGANAYFPQNNAYNFFTANPIGSVNATSLTSGSPSINTSGSTSPGTNTALSLTQSIQPRSVRVRYLIRYN